MSLEIETTGLRVEIIVAPTPEDLEEIIGEMIASAPMGTVSTDDVIYSLRAMKVPDPEKYKEKIERMISIDVGRIEEKIDE